MHDSNLRGNNDNILKRQIHLKTTKKNNSNKRTQPKHFNGLSPEADKAKLCPCFDRAFPILSE